MAEEITFDKNIEQLYKNKFVTLANELTQAKAKTSLLESKIEFLAIYRRGSEMRSKEKLDAHGKPYNVHYVEITAPEIKELMGCKGRSIYEQIAAAAFELKQKLFIYSDPQKNQFKMDNVFGEVAYGDGKLMVEFNPSTEYLFSELTQNFTKLKLDIAFKFRTNSGFQLYKILKTHTYVLPDVDPELPQTEQESMVKEFSLAELRMQMGYVDISQPELKKEGSKPHPDTEKMVSADQSPKFAKWSDFYRRCLVPGIEEINEKSDIYIVEVEKKRVAHGKVDGVRITVQNNLEYHKRRQDVPGSKVKQPRHLSDSQLIDFTDSMREFIKEPLKTRDLQEIARCADYDLEAIKKAYKASEGQEIDNLVGFLITAIEKGYNTPVHSQAEEILPAAETVPDSNDDMLDAIADEMDKISAKRVKTKDLREIAKYAKYDMKRIKKACSAAEFYSQRHDIDNPVAFILTAIREEYEPGEEIIENYDEAIAEALKYAEKRIANNA